MKAIIIKMIFVVFATSLMAQNPSITDITVNQRTDGSVLLDVYFKLSGPGSSYNIALQASFDGGASYVPIPPAYLSGDLSGISPGSNKHIVWDGMGSFPDTYNTQVKLKIIASVSGGGGNGQPCPGTPTVTDIDGNVYNTVLIGDQCWMKENLNTGTRINGSSNQTNNGTIEKYCYDNLESNCDTYGGLYQWNEMMGYSTTPGAQGICPTGWHIPSDAEWTVLTTYVRSQPEYLCNSNTSYIAKALAATTSWNSYSGICTVGNILSANNATFFTALPGGILDIDWSFNNQSIGGYWWSSSPRNASYAWNQNMNYNDAWVSRSYSNKSGGLSVRCLKDN